MLARQRQKLLLGRIYQRLSSSISASSESRLAGTVPFHKSYIFIHSTQPPASFAAKHHTPIQLALQQKVKTWGGIVNFSWSSHTAGKAARLGLNVFSATAFSRKGKLELPELSESLLDEVAEKLRLHAEGTSPAPTLQRAEVNLYVCTHGARDCRCGDIGGSVTRALREEVERRRDNNANSDIHVHEVAHVGGHKYAANVLVYPHGDWLGNVRPEDVPSVLDAIEDAPFGPSARLPEPLSPSLWRGRMGLTKEQQLALIDGTDDGLFLWWPWMLPEQKNSSHVQPPAIKGVEVSGEDGGLLGDS